MRDALFQTDGYVRLETDFPRKKAAPPAPPDFPPRTELKDHHRRNEPAFVAELECQPIENSDPA
jgi:hypothetical protein